MALIKTYRVEGTDLYFEEFLQWSFTPNLSEAVQVWKLKNVDKADLDKSKLEQIVSYDEDAEFEIEKVNDRTRLTIFTYFDHSEYFFNCDGVHTSKRPYSNSELTDIILNHQAILQDKDNQISKLRQTLDGIEKYLLREIDTKGRIAEQVSDKTSTASLKSKYQLDILNQLKFFLENHR
ncbi:hypothetical protein [Cyclobacterium plantarum]|uniref:hypothetical protein n=1 Tax=Cyclobacterium plantarum TaxID=2716263 RepID=UPI003F6EDCE4